MMLDDMKVVVPSNPLMDTAWTILEAANDLGDGATLEARRVINTTLRGETPAQSDVNVIVDVF